MAFVWSAETCTPEAEFSEVGECLFPFFVGIFLLGVRFSIQGTAARSFDKSFTTRHQNGGSL
jgi:hypothetical protein